MTDIEDDEYFWTGLDNDDYDPEGKMDLGHGIEIDSMEE